MISIGSQSNKVKYGVKHYILDTDEDFKRLPKTNLMGCTCFIISSSKYYMMNSQQKWVEITPYGKVISDDPGGSIPDDDIIYEGGEVGNNDFIYEGGDIGKGDNDITYEGSEI